MGVCWSKREHDDDDDDVEQVRPTTEHTNLHEGILRERQYDVYKKYEEIEVLGRGSIGHVARVQVKEGAEGGNSNGPTPPPLCERRQNKVDYALKSIQLDRVSSHFLDELRNEISILKAMDHPNIVKAHEVYTYKKQIYIILELCDGGDLYTRIPYSEKRAAGITGMFMSAVKYMHAHGIVHRDLKFENIIFENKSEDAEIRVIDFGLSKKFMSNDIGVMHEGVGTLYSMSPQVLQGVYTSQADLWSCGVITYMLLSSHRPFYHKERKRMIDKIMRVDYSFGKDYWKPISDEAKNFVDKLLVLDPKERMDAGEALNHVWLSKEFPLSDRVPDQSTADAVQGGLVHYKEVSELKKIALNVIAHKSTSNEILQLRKVFDQYDTGNDGVISLEEFEAAMKKNCPNENIQEIFKSIDVNKNGYINYTEFIAAALEAQGRIEEERVAEAFDRLDSDGSGYISKQDLRDFLGKKEGTTERINAIIAQGDKDNDGKISYGEFLQLFRKETKSLLHLVVKSTVSGSDDGLLMGLDSKIPGGKFDTPLPVN